MTLLVRNEADMVEANLDYHLAQGVDFVIVTDHDSTDGTDELLRRYQREGVVRLLRDDAVGHHQSRRVTRMARLAAAEYDADWVIHNDADEFWWPLSGTLRDVFAAIPPHYGQLKVRRVNFLPSADTDGPFYSTMLYREARSLTPRGVPLEPKTAHRGHPEVVVAPGNHSIRGAELRPVPAAEMLEIFHFPMRDYEQFERKVIQTGLGYEAVDGLGPGVGQDQLELLSCYRRGELRAYFEAALGDEDTRRRQLAAGVIVRDRRLEGFMRDLASGSEPVSWDGGGSTRALVKSLLSVEDELETVRNALRKSDAAVQQARDALRDREALLHEVRDSRLMRWTAPARRRWYALTGANRP